MARSLIGAEAGKILGQRKQPQKAELSQRTNAANNSGESSGRPNSTVAVPSMSHQRRSTAVRVQQAAEKWPASQ